jgi:thymidylate synthase (FAD)
MTAPRPEGEAERPRAPAADKLLGKRFPVLDDGFVYLVDYMGTDASVVQAARVSYGKGTKSLRTDQLLIDYLMRHGHTSPFEMCEIKLHVRVPMDCWRQWIRHRTASVNEYSTRYSVAIDAAHGTAPDQWRLQGTNNRQGSEGLLDPEAGAELSREEAELQRRAREVYERRLELGVAREQARKDLPLSTYTEAYWKIDLHNLFHFLALRLGEDAQWEIRQYAKAIAEITKTIWPMCWSAFERHRLRGASFSSAELDLIRSRIGTPEKPEGWPDRDWAEFLEKLRSR